MFITHLCPWLFKTGLFQKFNLRPPISNKGVFAVLLGSGVSRGSSIPPAWEVTLDLVRKQAILQGDDPETVLEGWYVGRYQKPPKYTKLPYSLVKTPAECRRLLHGYFEPTEEEREQGLTMPSPAHRAIARLAAKGYFKVILTTIFGRLIEMALREEGVERTVISTPDATEGAAPLAHQRRAQKSG